MRSPTNTATGCATDHHAGKWFLWDGTRWRREETKLAYRWAHQKAKTLAAGTDNAKAIICAGKAAFAAGVERLAQSDRAFAVTSEIWDADPWLLGTPGGTVDLRTGKIRAAAREDYITKTAAVAPADTPDCPLWLKFLNQACVADTGLIRFLQQWCGYSLTGSIQEHALLFVHGPGGNGKERLAQHRLEHHGRLLPNRRNGYLHRLKARSTHDRARRAEGRPHGLRLTKPRKAAHGPKCASSN